MKTFKYNPNLKLEGFGENLSLDKVVFKDNWFEFPKYDYSKVEYKNVHLLKDGELYLLTIEISQNLKGLLPTSDYFFTKYNGEIYVLEIEEKDPSDQLEFDLYQYYLKLGNYKEAFDLLAF